MELAKLKCKTNNKNEADQVQMAASLTEESLYSDSANGCHEGPLLLRGPMVQEKLQKWVFTWKLQILK